jgi:hypothetical protein
MTFARDHADQELLIARVREALAAIDAGQPVDPVALTADCPHLLQPLADVLGLAAELPQLQQQALREDPLAGLVLAQRYRLDACAGRGAMGVVYRGEYTQQKRPVAVKILDVRLFRDPQAEQRFQREAEALAALQHPHVVAVHDRGRTPEGIHFLVLEWLDGITLATLLERIGTGAGPLAAVAAATASPPVEQHWPRLCASWAVRLLHGLDAAHGRGLVHRDVKPSNVFLCSDGRPVLLDFGIAARHDDERLTATRTTLGTPWFMAPEQLRAGGLTVAEPTLDVYGLGATLYNLLAGRPPYQGDAASVLAALAHQDPAPLSAAAPELPRDLVAIVEHALERDPARRYPTATAFAADLEAFLQHRPVQARPLGALARRWRTWRRAPAKPIAAAAALLLALVFAFVAPWWWEQRAAARRLAVAELHAALPSVLAVEGWPAERVLAALRGEHEAALAQLDAILALAPDDVPVRLWRACLLLDLGDRARAAAELQRIAAEAPGAYLRELAARYLAAGPEQQGALAVSLQDLPAPASAMELYVAGFHELRLRHLPGALARAERLLAEAAASYLPARDLRLLAATGLAESAPAAQKQQLLQFVHDDSLQLEVVYGRPTARTLAMRGTALVMLERHAEAVPVLAASLALRPERHGPHQNLGVAFRRLGRLADAERELQTALRLRPFAWNTKYTLAQVALERGDHAAARSWAEQVPASEPVAMRWMRPNLLATIDVDEALLVRTDGERSRALAARAVAGYDAALRANPKSEELPARRAFAAALEATDLRAALQRYAPLVLAKPDDPYRLRNLAFLLPTDGLDALQTAWVTAVLRRVAMQQAGANQALRDSLQADIDQGLLGFR